MGDVVGGPALDQVARLIQQSLTPIFLLSALATLLGVFATRLSHVGDQVDAIAARLLKAGAGEAAALEVELSYMRRRSFALDLAVVLATFGGALTCASVLVLFVAALGGWRLATLLFGLFGGALVAAIGALVVFGYEMLLASRGLRRRSEKTSAPMGHH